jgi:hypothetical protein
VHCLNLLKQPCPDRIIGYDECSALEEEWLSALGPFKGLAAIASLASGRELGYCKFTLSCIIMVSLKQLPCIMIHVNDVKRSGVGDVLVLLNNKA